MANPESSKALSKIDTYRAKLRSIDRSQNPIGWAKLQSGLANSLAQEGDSENIELAIHHCQLALEVLTRETLPKNWADAQQILGFAHHNNCSLENNTQSAEEAIIHYELALQVKTYESLPYEWAMIHANLGDLYLYRHANDAPNNIELALQHSQLALNVYTPETYPLEWASVQHNLGRAYTRRIQGSRADSIEQAIDHYQLSLSKFGVEALPYQWARGNHGLAEAYLDRIYGARAENFELAIYYCQLALKVYTRKAYPGNWAGLQFTLANAYLTRVYGVQSDNIEQASDHYRFSLQVWTRDTHPVLWALSQHGLAKAFLLRDYGEPETNINQSIHHCQLALTVKTRESSPDDWARIQNTLANAYAHLINGEREDNIERAIYHYELALGIYIDHAWETEASVTYFNLGNIYRKRTIGDYSDNINKAIRYFELALAIQEANSLYLNQLATKRSLGKLYFDIHKWADAYDIFYEAIEIGNKLLGLAYSELGRRSEIEETAELYEQAAYCLIQLGSLKEALLLLEQGKARLLTEILLLENADLTVLSEEESALLKTTQQKVHSLENDIRFYTGPIVHRNDRKLAELLNDTRQELANVIANLRSIHSDFLPTEAKLSDIMNLITEGRALVIPLITSQGSAVFVLQGKSETITEEHIIRLDTFRTAELDNLLIGNEGNPGLLSAYISAFHPELQQLNRFSKGAWKIALEKVTQYLWDNLLVFVHEKLIRSRIKHIVLILSGGLRLLPLHAGWRMSEGRPTYLLDDYEVTYAPSASSFGVCDHRAAAPHGKDALIVGVGEYLNLSSLFTSTVEARTIAAQFGVDALLNNEATKKAVIQGMAGKAYLHFSCHGLYAWKKDPLSSALYLAGDEPFTLLELLSENVDLRATRLVTLSACESGISDVHQLSNEFIGLPAGFLQAGSPAVISTLWSVDENSTAMLMERFYEKHLSEGISLSQAIREAQLWLRDVTRQELGGYLKQKGTKEALVAYQEIMLGGNSTDKLYAHPFYWAAFTFFGA